MYITEGANEVLSTQHGGTPLIIHEFSVLKVSLRLCDTKPLVQYLKHIFTTKQSLAQITL